ncbi:MAG: hydrogenase nickel incorporation protein HypA [Proteobacteria bacterium]|nr:hydrogenase nickel incorporation protein HypA [Pseudomonadota bacterium]
MHELSLCQNVIDQVTALAAEHRARSVARITVRIGVLSGVEPMLLESAFTIARAGTVADQAELVTEGAPARVLCRACGEESQAQPSFLRCRACGSTDTRLTGGDELTLAQVELVVAEDAAPSARTAIPSIC